MLYFMLGAGILLLSVLFRLAAVFRLTIPLAYALVAPTLFHDWYYSHYALANGIWYAMLALVLLSWVVSLVRRVREVLDRRRLNKFREEILVQRVLEAGRNGGGAVRTDDLFWD